jgi:hypothetical protein
MAILNFGKDSNIVEAVINAVIGGYRDDLILEELAQAIEDEKVTQEQFESTSQALQLYKKRFVASIDNITNAMNQFEFNERKSILKNRPMNLAQQVMHDVEGFEKATKEFYVDDEMSNEASVKSEADIKKPVIDKPEIK